MDQLWCGAWGFPWDRGMKVPLFWGDLQVAKFFLRMESKTRGHHCCVNQGNLCWIGLFRLVHHSQICPYLPFKANICTYEIVFPLFLCGREQEDIGRWKVRGEAGGNGQVSKLKAYEGTDQTAQAISFVKDWNGTKQLVCKAEESADLIPREISWHVKAICLKKHSNSARSKERHAMPEIQRAWGYKVILTGLSPAHFLYLCTWPPLWQYLSFVLDQERWLVGKQN